MKKKGQVRVNVLKGGRKEVNRSMVKVGSWTGRGELGTVDRKAREGVDDH
jgi:hypothetical protein